MQRIRLTSLTATRACGRRGTVCQLTESLPPEDVPLVGLHRPLQSVEEPNAPSPFRQTARLELRDKIRSALGSLQPREAEIIRLRFGIDCAAPHTLEEIGEMLELSRERIRQIQAAAMRKLHEFRVLESLLEFSGVN